MIERLTKERIAQLKAQGLKLSILVQDENGVTYALEPQPGDVFSVTLKPPTEPTVG